MRFERPEATGPLQAWLGYVPETYERKARAATPLAYVDEHDPPTMIVHGTNDRLIPVEQGRLFFEALEAAGVTVVYVPVEGDGHGIAAPDAYRRIAEFFDEHLGGRSRQRQDSQVGAAAHRDDRINIRSRSVPTDDETRALTRGVLESLDDNEIVLAVHHSEYRLHLSLTPAQ